MATCKSTEITGSPFAEELDVLTAIYSDDIKIVTSSSSACSTPTSAQECSEASQCLPLTLEVRINKEAFVHFHIQGILLETFYAIFVGIYVAGRYTKTQFS